jgi:hypothetical protein
MKKKEEWITKKIELIFVTAPSDTRVYPIEIYVD